MGDVSGEPHSSPVSAPQRERVTVNRHPAVRFIFISFLLHPVAFFDAPQLKASPRRHQGFLLWSLFKKLCLCGHNKKIMIQTVYFATPVLELNNTQVFCNMVGSHISFRETESFLLGFLENLSHKVHCF